MLEIVPLGGLGEFGMNMMAFTWGETTLVVDAGVMFPDPELLGVDRIIPDLTYLQRTRRGRCARADARPRRSHRRRPARRAALKGPVYGTPLTLALVEPKLREHGHRGLDRARPGSAARARDHRAVHASNSFA